MHAPRLGSHVPPLVRTLLMSVARPRGQRLDSVPEHLSVLSYNLLAPLYVRPIDERTGGVQPFAAFEWAADADLDWSRRQPRLLSDLTSSRADIICLQEVQYERSDDEFVLPEWLRLEGYGCAVPGQKELRQIATRNARVLKSEVAVGNALLYRLDRLERVEGAGGDGGGKAIRDATTRVCVCVRGREGSALAALGRTAVFAVHLDAKSEEARIKTLGRCVEICRAYGTRDAVVCGDLNSEMLSGSAMSAFLAGAPAPTEEELERECASALRLSAVEPAGDESEDDAAPDGEDAAGAAAAEASAAPSAAQLDAWRALLASASRLASDERMGFARIQTGATRAAHPHGCPQGPCVSYRLDHLLYTPRSLRPRTHWGSLEDEPASAESGLPNELCPSDHLPVAATFEPVAPERLEPSRAAEVLARLAAVSEAQAGRRASLASELSSEVRAQEESEAPATAAPADPPVEEKRPPAKSKKARGATGPPSLAMQALKRSHRQKEAELKAELQKERDALLEALGELELDAIEEGGVDLQAWREGRQAPKAKK